MGNKGIEYLESSHITEASKEFRSSITKFEGYVDKLESTTATLLDSWDGKGRNRFETEYLKMKRQLTDITDVLYDLYDALVDADTAYIDADEEIGKKISAASSS